MTKNLSGEGEKIQISFKKPKQVIKESWWILLTYILIGGLLLLYKFNGYL